MNFIVYNKQGKILRTGDCPDKDFFLQAGNDEFVMEGVADDISQKIVNVGIEAKIVNKTLEEIQSEKLSEKPEKPFEKRMAIITNEQWQSVLDRLKELENA